MGQVETSCGILAQGVLQIAEILIFTITARRDSGTKKLGGGSPAPHGQDTRRDYEYDCYSDCSVEG